MRRSPGQGDAGSAAVDFALVGGLLTVLFVSVLQLALVLHVRSTLTDCASEGARLGARADRAPSDGLARARELAGDELSDAYAGRITGASAGEVDVGGARAVEVRLTAPLPVIGLIGPAAALTVTGHAYLEKQ